MTADGAKVQALPRPAKRTDWRASLARGSSGAVIPDLRNVIAAFRQCPELANSIRFNEMNNAVETALKLPWRTNAPGSPWTETDDAEACAYLQAADIAVGRVNLIADAVQIVARDWSWHPLRQHLLALTHDGEPRLGIMLAAYFGARGSQEYLAAVGRRFMVSAVARVFRPGCQADHALVLEGAQGIGKSSAVRVLAIRPEWYAGSLPDMHTKDAALQLVGRWIVELSELRAVRSSEIEATKAFLSTCHDTLRPPYGRRSIQIARQCAFVGTTNEAQYLRDKTGNRRFWPVHCERIDVAGLEADRDQLWAEAVALYNAGEQWHLTRDEEALAVGEQAERVQRTELEADVAEYLADLRRVGKYEVTVRDVLAGPLNINPEDASYAERARKLGGEVAKALELCGWQRIARQGRGDNRRTVYRLEQQATP